MVEAIALTKYSYSGRVRGYPMIQNMKRGGILT